MIYRRLYFIYPPGPHTHTHTHQTPTFSVNYSLSDQPNVAAHQFHRNQNFFEGHLKRHPPTSQAWSLLSPKFRKFIKLFGYFLNLHFWKDAARNIDIYGFFEICSAVYSRKHNNRNGKYLHWKYSQCPAQPLHWKYMSLIVVKDTVGM